MTQAVATVEEVVEESILNRRASSREDIAALAVELRRVRDSRRDIIAPHSDVTLTLNEDGDFRLNVDLGQPFGIVAFKVSKYAHTQLGNILGPSFSAYYRRTKTEWPEGLVINVNHWLQESNRLGLFRTLDDTVRAVLSNSYKIIDNADLLFSVLQNVDSEQINIVRAELTDTRFYLRLHHAEWRERIDRQQDIARGVSGNGLFEGISDGIGRAIHDPLEAVVSDGGGKNLVGTGAMYDASRDGDLITPGCIISNSETGHGRVQVEPFLFRVYCRNTAIFGESIRKTHLGTAKELSGILSDETISKESDYVLSAVNDIVKATFDHDIFLAMVEKFDAGHELLLADPREAVAQIVKAHPVLPKSAEDAILNNLLGGDAFAQSNTVYGLVNAVTAYGREQEAIDLAVAVERIGGALVDNPRELVRVRR